MKGPPTVLQDELLRSIGELEAMIADLQGVNAEVSVRLSEQLRRLRVGLERTQSPQARRLAWEIISEVVRVIAAEVVRRVIEASISTSPALLAREQVYGHDVGWRVHQNAARLCWSQAA